jgi:hypothetical protein
MAPYPIKPEIQDMFPTLSTGGDFFAHVLDDGDRQIVGPLASEQSVRQQDRVPGRHTKVPGRQGADGAVEDVRRQCCRRRGGEDTAAVEMKSRCCLQEW